MAELILASHPDQPSQINAAFQRTLARMPTDIEREDVEQFMGVHERKPDQADALTHLCLSLFNCNEFIFVD